MQRRQLVRSGAWLLATSASVTLSWFGVHTVVEGTVYDPPQALPVSEQTPSPFAPQASSTHRPKPPPSTTAPPPPRETGEEQPEEQRGDGSGAGAGPDGADSAGSGSARGDGTGGGPGSAASGKVRGTTVDGGRVVFDIGEDSAALVSATPDEGWDMKVWKTSTWIRVTFTKGQQASSVFCRWDRPPPRVQQFDG